MCPRAGPGAWVMCLCAEASGSWRCGGSGGRTVEPSDRDSPTQIHLCDVNVPAIHHSEQTDKRDEGHLMS